MTILITGAAGSIGSELVRQLSKTNNVIAVDQDESGLYDLEGCTPVIANIRDRERLNDIFSHYKPDIVYHAAAYKHLSSYEKENLYEVIETNIQGTKNVIETAKKYKVKKLVFISTDKAVNPTSLMGTTKLLGEIMAKRSGYIVVRFGNVFGSRGSVIKKWEKQAKEGKPITITDIRMTRYFMSIKDACKLVIEASKKGKGGEIFILDMGEQKKLIDIAKGYSDKIKIIGAKEGEKLCEELMTEEEIIKAKKIKDFYVIK